MPFFLPVVHSDILFGCGSLQVQRPKTKKEKKIKKSQGKRVYLFTSNGSITMEAAIVTTIFMFVIFSVIGYLTLMNRQLAVQMKINNVAIAMSKMKFYEQAADKISDYSETLRKLKSNINLSGEKEQENDWDEIDIVHNFSYTIPWINKTIRLTERCLVKDWTGYDITKSQELVYITKNGRVYHTTKECSHLSLKIRKINYQQLSIERNNYGQKYSRCTICVKSEPTIDSNIFVTEDGTKYHNSLTCSGLLRNIITIEKSKVKNMLPCSRCSGGENGF